MIADICAIVGTGFLIVGAIIGAAWRMAVILRDLASEVRGHNKRLDFHKELLDELKVEFKTCQMNFKNNKK